MMSYFLTEKDVCLLYTLGSFWYVSLNWLNSKQYFLKLFLSLYFSSSNSEKCGSNYKRRGKTLQISLFSCTKVLYRIFVDWKNTRIKDCSIQLNSNSCRLTSETTITLLPRISICSVLLLFFSKQGAILLISLKC